MAYNGWKNKETWLVNLWLGDMFSDLKEEGWALTADCIKDEVEGITSAGVEEGFMRDLFNCALGEIDYHELAEHYKDT